MLVEAIVDGTHYFGKDKDRTQVTLRFPDRGDGFTAGMWGFEYAGPPRACHQPDAILKLDLSGGDALKQAAYEKVSTFLPAIIPLLTAKMSGVADLMTPNVMKGFDAKSLFGVILGAFSVEQLNELEAQIASERSRRG